MFYIVLTIEYYIDVNIIDSLRFDLETQEKILLAQEEKLSSTLSSKHAENLIGPLVSSLKLAVYDAQEVSFFFLFWILCSFYKYIIIKN